MKNTCPLFKFDLYLLGLVEDPTFCGMLNAMLYPTHIKINMTYAIFI